jgi:butyryl-CoA:acetate CoA-transferase
MMDVQKEYQSKLVSADEAVKCVKSGDWVDYSLAFTIPIDLDEALAKRLPELEDLKIRSGITSTPRKVLEADMTGEHLTYMDWHWTGYIRNMIKKGSKNIYFEPLLYRNLPMHYRKNLHVNVAMVMTTPMNDKGYFNFSLTNSATRAILDCADVIIIETNKNLPWVYGVKEECVHISEVDYVVEGSSPAIPTLPDAGEPTEIDKAVASYVVPEIVDGSTLQLGIGGMPNAIGAAIADSDLKDLGIHTEMLVDAYYKMFQAGKITNSRKNIDKGRGVFGFAQGSNDLYEWARENPGLVSAPIDYCNDPYNMALNDNMMSINNCIEMDLFGQVCAEASGTRQLSGTGGQLDFLTGAHMSRGGKAFICMSSSFTDKKTGETKSRIVPRMREGSITTDPRNQAMYIVTEYGIVNLAGRSTWEIAESLISIAHPKTRDGLIAEAEKMNIWRRSNKR